MSSRILSYLTFLFVLFSSGNVAFAQPDLKMLTISITDTSKSEYQQAEDIYTWITRNIQYDIKAFEDFDYSNRTTEEVLSSKKGVCSDFSRLMVAMCNSVGIESYSINGYVKGFRYTEGSPFIRTSHSWNAIRTDSTWILADATWGSGAVELKPGTLDLGLYYIFRLPYSNRNLYFHQDPDFNYFNIDPDTLVKTHYPLDPKWLLREFPMSFYHFESDSLPETTPYPDYQQRILELKNKNEYQVYKLEAINGNKYNSHNYFDLACSYFEISKGYDLEREMRESNVYQFENYLKDFDIINRSISRYKAISDSVYRLRSGSLKKLSGEQKRLSGKIQSKAKSTKKSFRSGQKQILGKNTTYKGKISAMTINMGRTELKKIQPGTYTDSIGMNRTEFTLLANEVNELNKLEAPILASMDSLLKQIDRQIGYDASIDDTLDKKNRKLNKNIIEYYDMVLTGEEFTIRKYVDTLKVVYAEILDFFGQKKQMKTLMQETSKQYFARTGELQKLLNQQMTLLRKGVRLSGNRDSAIAVHNEVVDRLIGSYKGSIKLTQRLSNYTSEQRELKKKNLLEIKTQQKNIKRASAFFTKWYSDVVNWEKALYEKDKEQIKMIQSESIRNKKLVQMKLDRYKQELEKEKK